MEKVIKRKTWLSGTGIKSCQYCIEVSDVNYLFDNVCENAEILAINKNGSVDIKRTKDLLYISYLDVPNTNHIDSIYLVQ